MKGWQEAARALVNLAPLAHELTEDSEDAEKLFVRPPQSMWVSTRNPANRDDRSPLCSDVKGSATFMPRRGDLKKGIFEVVLFCAAPGVRTIVKETPSSKEKPRCRAGLILRIDGTDAEYADVTIKEACVHLAQRFCAEYKDAAGGHRATPRPEPSGLTISSKLRADIATQMAYVAVNTVKTNIPSSTHAALAFAAPTAEKVLAVWTNAGGTTTDNVYMHAAVLKHGGETAPLSDAIRARNDAIQRVCDARADCIARCDFMKEDRTFIILMDAFRARMFWRHATFEDRKSVLDLRGVVMDFSGNFVNKCVLLPRASAALAFIFASPGFDSEFRLTAVDFDS